MTEAALWFGDSGRPLFGRLNVPDGGEVQGAVVLAPPLGLEGVCAQRTYQRLAGQLADGGLLVLRLDYDGTGDSAGNMADKDRVTAWSNSIRAGVRWVRSAGAEWVGVVGMRLGATLATSVASSEPGGTPIDALVLWDPCPSGRSYLREQQALRSFSLGGERRTDGSVEVPGLVFGPSTVEELSSLAIAETTGPLARHVLVLSRPERPLPAATKERLTDVDVEWGEATGQADLVDVEPFTARVPEEAMVRIASWLSDHAPTRTTSVVFDRVDRVTVEQSEDGRAIVESICRFGPTGLFGISTESEAGSSGPTIVFLNSGVLDHVGPARLWVELSRQLARGGLKAVRFDLSGLGNSPTRLGQRDDVIYPPEALDDLVEVAAAVSPGDPSAVVFVGLCSGGYHALEGGNALSVRGVLGINPSFTARPAELQSTEVGGRAPTVDPRRTATTARKRWVRALPAHAALGSIVDRLPDRAWWLINRIAVEHPPAQTIRRLVDAGVDVQMICGERETRLIRRGQDRALRQLGRSGRFEMATLEGIDHELFGAASRERVMPVVIRYLLTTFA